MIRQVAFLVIALVAANDAGGQGRLEGSGSGNRFISEKYGFSMAVPPGWHVSLEKDTPMFINFSSAEGRSQLTLPKGGAVIVVVAQDALPGRHRLGSSTMEWATTDARGVSSGSPSIKPLQVPKESGVSQAVMSSYDVATYSPDEQAQNCVAAFWEFDQKLFAAHLYYVARDPKGSELEKIFVNTVRSIRPLEKSEKH